MLHAIRRPLAAVELARLRTLLARPDAERERTDRRVHIYRQEVRPFTDKQIDARQELRRAGRHCNRERAVAQRTASTH